MQMTITPTTRFFMHGKVMVRVWEGTTDNGAHILALVSLVATADQRREMELGLVSIPPPTPADAQAWAEHIMKQADLPP